METLIVKKVLDLQTAKGDDYKKVDVQKTDGSSESQLRSLSKIRFKSLATAVLQMQYPPRGTRSYFHRKDEKGGGQRVCRADTKRPPSVRQSPRPLPRIAHGLPTKGGRIYKIK